MELQVVVLHILTRSPKDGVQQFLFGSQLGLALWTHFADQNVTWLDVSSSLNDPAFIKISQGLLGDVGDVPVNSSRPSLVSRISTSKSSIWIEV